MMKPMNTGGVQWMELQSCNEQGECDVRNYTHKVMPSEHYGESGAPHQWENKKNRTTSLFHLRLRLQRVSCVSVVLCLLLMSSSFFSCAAADGTNGVLATITDCFPNVLIFPSQSKYYCEVENAGALSGLNLRTAYYHNGELFPGWSASLVPATNLIAFEPDSEAVSGNVSLVIARRQGSTNPTYLPVTNTFPMITMSYGGTRASFTSNSAYYGLKAKLEANFPNTNTILHYLLVPPQSDCEAIAKNCNAAGGCYSLTTSAFLPTPGNYSLCLGANEWRGHYLPWDTRLLEVKWLVSTTPYMSTVGSNTLLLRDAVTGAIVTDMRNVFLVRCPDNVCPTVSLNNGEQIVSADVCTGSTQGDRMYLPTKGGSFSATSGVYAVCAEFDTEVGISPAALPVTVLQDPFVFNVTVRTNTSVTIGVRGGDLSWRKESYKVCAMPPDTSCESVATAQDAVCVESASSYSPSVDVDTTSLYSKYEQSADNVTFCVVASDVTFHGRRYLWSRDVKAAPPPPDDGGPREEAKSDKSSVVLIVVIVLAVVAAILIVADIVVCLLRRRKQQQQRQRKERMESCVATPRTSHTTSAMPTHENSFTTNAAQTESSVGSVNEDVNARNAVDIVDDQVRGSDVMPRENEMRTRPSVRRYPIAPHNLPVRTDVVNAAGSRPGGESFQGDVGYEVDRGSIRGNIPQYWSRASSRLTSPNDARRGSEIIPPSRSSSRNQLENTSTPVIRLREVRRGMR